MMGCSFNVAINPTGLALVDACEGASVVTTGSRGVTARAGLQSETLKLTMCSMGSPSFSIAWLADQAL